MNPSEKKRSAYKASRGVIADPLGNFNRKVYKIARDGVVGRYLSGYDRLCGKFEKTYFIRKIKYLKKRKMYGKNNFPKREKLPEEAKNVGAYSLSTIPMSITDRFSLYFDRSVTSRLLLRLKNKLLYTPAMTYGALFFAFSLFMLLSQIAVLFCSLYGVVTPRELIFGEVDKVTTLLVIASSIVIMTTSTMLMFVRDISMYALIMKSGISGFILKKVIGIREASIKNELLESHGGKAFFLGMLIGLTTLILPPTVLFVAVAFALLSALIINIPEFGLIISILSLPFLTLTSSPTKMILILSIILVIGTVLKLIRGKRVLKFEISDLWILVFMLLVFLGGVASVGGFASVASATTFTVLGLVYFATVVLVKSEETLERCLNAFMFSSSVVSLIGIIEWLLGQGQSIWHDKIVFDSISGRVVSLWENPNVLAEFLLVAVFISFGCMFGKKGVKRKMPAFLSLVLSLSCLVLTWSRGAWLSLAIAAILMLLILSPKTFPCIAVAACIGFVSFSFLPEAFSERVLSIFTASDSSSVYRINIWKGVSKLARKYFFTGVGVGETAFSEVYPSVALEGVEAVPHTHNLFLQILVELGIFGLIIFIIAMLTLFRSGFSLFRKKSMKNSSSVTVLSFMAAITALLINGMTDYVWYNYRIYFLFWFVAGLITAVRRIELKNSVELTGEFDSCDIDIAITRKGRVR